MEDYQIVTPFSVGAIAVLESFSILYHKLIVYDCHKVSISHHKPIFNQWIIRILQHRTYFKRSNSLTDRAYLSRFIHLPIFLRLSGIFDLLTPYYRIHFSKALT